MGYLQSCRRHLAIATPHECQKACLQYWYTQKKHEVTIQNYVCLASIGQIQRHYPIMKTDGPCLLPYTTHPGAAVVSFIPKPNIYPKLHYLSCSRISQTIDPFIVTYLQGQKLAFFCSIWFDLFQCMTSSGWEQKSSRFK